MSQVTKRRPPTHPGEILEEDFLAPMGLTPYAVAAAVRVQRTRIERLVKGETSVTADTALQLGRFLGTSASFWMNLQTQFDLKRASDRLGPDIEQIEPRVA